MQQVIGNYGAVGKIAPYGKTEISNLDLWSEY